MIRFGGSGAEMFWPKERAEPGAIPMTETPSGERAVSDRNVENLIAKHRQRAAMGLSKYGVTTERTDLSTRDWLVHAQDEAMDLAVYLQRIIDASAQPAPTEPLSRSRARLEAAACGEPLPVCGGGHFTAQPADATAASEPVPSEASEARDVMPVFQIKAKDNLATHAICAYYAACICNGLPQQAEQVVAALTEIMDWREAHKSECKWPDHQHAPAGTPGSGSETAPSPPPSEPAPAPTDNKTASSPPLLSDEIIRPATDAVGEELPPLSESETAAILCQCDGDKIILHVAAPERTKPWDNTPLEYAVVSIRPERNCPQHMVVFGKYDTYGWLANPSLRGLVNLLMAHAAALREQLAALQADYEKQVEAQPHEG